MNRLQRFFQNIKTIPPSLPRILPRGGGFAEASLRVVRRIVEEYLTGFSIDEGVEGLILEEYELPFNVKARIVRSGSLLKYVVEEPPVTQGIVDQVSRLVLGVEADGFKGLEAPGVEVVYNYSKIVSGYGPLYPFTMDEGVEEVSLDRKNGRIHVIHSKYSWYGWLPSNVTVRGDLVDRLVLSLARRSGRHISLHNPIAEGLTREGLRVSLTFGDEVSRSGSSIVIRRRPGTPVAITRLVAEGFLNTAVAAYLWLILESRGWVIIAGSVGAGKTTLLQALLTLIPPSRRVVTIEDTPELNGSTGLWDPLVERHLAVKQGASITSYDLLRFALRRRPDYIVVGEVRGVEARLLVQASRLGHGVLTTIHADNPRSVVERLAAPPISIPRSLLRNISTIVMVSNNQGLRRVSAVCEVGEGSEILEICGGPGSCASLTPSVLASLSERLQGLGDKERVLSMLEKKASFLDDCVSKQVFHYSKLSERLLEYYLSGSG